MIICTYREKSYRFYVITNDVIPTYYTNRWCLSLNNSIKPQRINKTTQYANEVDGVQLRVLLLSAVDCEYDNQCSQPKDYTFVFVDSPPNTYH